MQEGPKKSSLIKQVAALFVLCVVLIGLLTFFVQRLLSYSNIKKQVEVLADEIAEEVMQSVWEYPSYGWLLRFWYEHPDELDIEYDVDYSAGTETEEKVHLFQEHQPDIAIKYATEEQLNALPKEDQILYAEIAYSWLITHVNQIKRSYGIDYVFCVITQEPYTEQFFLFSAAEAGAVRGTEYENAYILGTTVTVSESQQEAMRNAKEDNKHLADAGDYMDYYAYMCDSGDQTVLIGLTYNLSWLKNSITNQTWQGTFFAVLFQILLSLLILGLLSLFVLKPIKQMQKSIRVYKETKDSKTVRENLSEIHANNEVGQLAEDFSSLSEEIDEYLRNIEEISAEKEKISAELTLASRIQSGMIPSMFPPYPDRTEFDLYGSMDPALEVGGDFYDFFMVDDDHLCLVIADVSGKGIPAALFMMAAQISLSNKVRMGLTPGEALENSNMSFLKRTRNDMFVTIWLGILEISTGKLIASNAGHEYPIIKHAGGQYELYRDPHSFVVGGMEDVKYKEYEVQLEPGSMLFLYTDGVPEATNSHKEMFGTDRMLSVLNKDVSASPEVAIRNITEAVDQFVGAAEQFDDLTMLCLEYKGPERKEGED